MKIILLTTCLAVFCFSATFAPAADKVVVIPLGSSTAVTATSSDITSAYIYNALAGQVSQTLLTLPADKGFILTSFDIYGGPYIGFTVYEASSGDTVKFTDKLLPPLVDNLWTGKIFATGVTFARGTKIMLDYYIPAGTGSTKPVEVLIQGYYF